MAHAEGFNLSLTLTFNYFPYGRYTGKASFVNISLTFLTFRLQYYLKRCCINML